MGKMERLVRPQINIELENNKYREDLAKLQETNGWYLLTPRQQKIIRACQLLQPRAERDMDPNHKNDPYYFDWFKKTEFRPQYQKSLEHIKNLYCHTAIYALENESISGEAPRHCPKEFFDAAYFMFTHEFELKKALEFFGFPCVVHASTENGNEYGETTKAHSFLVLGKDHRSDTVVWGKTRIKEPYKVTTLSQVFLDYPYIKYWGIRKLRGQMV